MKRRRAKRTIEKRQKKLQLREETKKNATPSVVLNVFEVWPRSDVAVLFADLPGGCVDQGSVAWRTRSCAVVTHTCDSIHFPQYFFPHVLRPPLPRILGDRYYVLWLMASLTDRLSVLRIDDDSRFCH